MSARRSMWACLGIVVLVGSGCTAAIAGAGHTSSPWELGGTVRGMALYPLGPAGLSGGPVATYSYLKWDGGGGKDHLFEVGGQLRKSFPMGVRSPWVGVEAGFARMNSSGSGYSESSNGWSTWVHAGVPVTSSVSVFGGGGITGLWDGTGKNVRIGLEITP